MRPPLIWQWFHDKSLLSGGECSRNAYWHRLYGRAFFCPHNQYTANTLWGFINAFDVMARLWGEGITDARSSLGHSGEPGALRASFSNMAAAAGDFHYGKSAADAWLIGEDSDYVKVRPNVEAIHDMSDPNDYNAPDTYKGTYWHPVSANISECVAGNEFCGAQTNGGVGDKMFQLLVDGGTHNDVTVSGVGISTAFSIALRANASYWPRPNNWLIKATYAQGRAGMLDAARILGFPPQTINAVADAWDAVSVTAALNLSLSAAMVQNGRRTLDVNNPIRPSILLRNVSDSRALLATVSMTAQFDRGGGVTTSVGGVVTLNNVMVDSTVTLNMGVDLNFPAAATGTMTATAVGGERSSFCNRFHQQ